MKKSVIAVAAAAAALFLASGAAVAADLVCTHSESGGTWRNVLVPAGESCTLQDMRVTGSVTVQANGTLNIVALPGDTITINGDIKGYGCDSINLESTGAGSPGRIVVGGNLTIQNCTGVSFSGARGSSFSPPVPPQNVLIGGSVKCSNNAANCVFDYIVISGNLDCSGNDGGCTLQSDAVGNNATINNNSSPPSVNNSIIGGDAKCAGNTGVVTGSGNTVAGARSGQCSAI
jgi:hypothetical protein